MIIRSSAYLLIFCIVQISARNRSLRLREDDVVETSKDSPAFVQQTSSEEKSSEESVIEHFPHHKRFIHSSEEDKIESDTIIPPPHRASSRMDTERETVAIAPLFPPTRAAPPVVFSESAEVTRSQQQTTDEINHSPRYSYVETEYRAVSTEAPEVLPHVLSSGFVQSASSPISQEMDSQPTFRDTHQEEALVFSRQGGIIVPDSVVAQRTLLQDEEISTPPLPRKHKKKRVSKKKKKGKRGKKLLKKRKGRKLVKKIKTTLAPEYELPTYTTPQPQPFIQASIDQGSTDEPTGVTMRRLKIGPRGGKHIKNSYQNLKSYNEQLLEEHPELATSSVAAVAAVDPQDDNVIVDKESGQAYSRDDLAQMCSETASMGRTWGITDVADFARKNCFLIQLYYSKVSCGQIVQFVDYCKDWQMLRLRAARV